MIPHMNAFGRFNKMKQKQNRRLKKVIFQLRQFSIFFVCLFLYYGWFLQNLEKGSIRTNMHTTVATSQRYTYRVLQTIQMKLILLLDWVELATFGSAKTALKFKFEILIG